MLSLAKQGVAIAVTVLSAGVLDAQDAVWLPIQDRVVELDLEFQYEVGGINGPSWAQFSALSFASFAPDGTLYLLDSRAAQVVAVDANGDFRHFVGRKGNGPGEYQLPEGLVALANGDLVIFDARKRAFLRYSSDGTLISEVRPDFRNGVPSGPFAVTETRALLSLPMRMVTGRLGSVFMTGSGVSRVEGSIPLLDIRLEDDAPVTVHALLAVPQRADEQPSAVIRAFEPQPSYGVLADNRTAVFGSEDYRIDILGPGGTLLRTIRRGLNPRPTTAADRRAYLQHVREGEAARPRRMGTRGNGPSPRERPQPWYYPVVTPLLSIATDGRNVIWVLRRNPDDANLPGPIDLVSSSGSYRGTVHSNERGLPVAFGPANMVAFFEHDGLDVPVARVYRLLSAIE